MTRNESRAGFGVRALAIAIDLTLVGILVAGIGLWLTQVTGGKVRLSNTIINALACVPQERVPAEIRMPEDFKVADVRRCTRSLLGIEHDWALTVVEDAESVAARRQILVPLDSAGRVTNPFYLDNLVPLLLVLYLFLFEWRFGATIGKRALGIQVLALNGAPIGFTQAGRRSLMRLIPFLAMITSAIVLGLDADPLRITAFDPPTGGKYSFDLWPWSNDGNIDFRGIDDVVMIAFLLNYVVTTARRTLPWHDRWAGTEAVLASRAVGPEGIRK
jgi:hypothetical protein